MERLTSRRPPILLSSILSFLAARPSSEFRYPNPPRGALRQFCGPSMLPATILNRRSGVEYLLTGWVEELFLVSPN